MDYIEIEKELKKGIYRPIYFLCGEEPYYIDLIGSYLENNILKEEEKAFNQSIFYGKDTEIDYILDTAMEYPIMAEKKVIILKEAHESTNLNALSSYIDHIQPTTILVILYKKKIDKRLSFFKKLEKAKNCLFFESKIVKEYDMNNWVKDYCLSKKYKISPKAINMLTESLGNDIGKMSNEIGKLTIILPENGTITEEMIEKNVGISRDYNVFELISAITHRDVVKASTIVNYFSLDQKNHNIIPTIKNIFNYFLKLLTYHYHKNNASQKEIIEMLSISPYFLKDYKYGATVYSPMKCSYIISMLRNYDLKTKGVNFADTANSGDLLKEIIFKIIH